MATTRARASGTRPARSGGAARTRATVIKCGAVLDIGAVRRFRTHLLAAVAKKQSATLDAAQLTRIDTAGIQLLYALTHDLQKKGLRLRWRNVPEPVQVVARLLGLTRELGLPP